MWNVAWITVGWFWTVWTPRWCSSLPHAAAGSFSGFCALMYEVGAGRQRWKLTVFGITAKSYAGVTVVCVQPPGSVPFVLPFQTAVPASSVVHPFATIS